MKETPFRFRLSSVLRLARVHEDEGQRLLATEVAAEAWARGRADACAEAYAACASPGPAGGGYALTAVADFKARAASAALRAEALRLAQAESRVAGERLGAARDEVVGRVRRRRSLEELEDRHRTLHAEEAGRAAQRSLDELVSTRRRAR